MPTESQVTDTHFAVYQIIFVLGLVNLQDLKLKLSHRFKIWKFT